MLTVIVCAVDRHLPVNNVAIVLYMVLLNIQCERWNVIERSVLPNNKSAKCEDITQYYCKNNYVRNKENYYLSSEWS